VARVRCPSCGDAKNWALADGRRRCSACRKTWTLRGNQVRLNAHWRKRLAEFFALGVPAYRLRFVVPLSEATVLRFYSQVREAIFRETEAELRELAGALELDESAFGGRRKGKRGWGAEGKVVVFGIYKRNGTVHTFPLPARKRGHVLPLIEAHTRPGSLFFTDGWEAYASLGITGSHVVVKKEKGRPVGRDHVNGIEGFWSYAKHQLYQFRGVPKDRFHLYLREAEWRFNHRNENLVPLVESLLRSKN
jgi:transposase